MYEEKMMGISGRDLSIACSMEENSVLGAYLKHLTSRFGIQDSISPEQLGLEVHNSMLDLQRGVVRSTGEGLALTSEDANLLVGKEWKVYEQLKELVLNAFSTSFPDAFCKAFGRALFHA